MATREEIMQCKTCGVWQRRDTEINQRLLHLVPDIARLLSELPVTDEWKQLVNAEASRLRLQFRYHVSLMDSLCPKGQCLLIDRNGDINTN